MKTLLKGIGEWLIRALISAAEEELLKRAAGVATPKAPTSEEPAAPAA